jgi:hypothetical protein
MVTDNPPTTTRESVLKRLAMLEHQLGETLKRADSILFAVRAMKTEVSEVHQLLSADIGPARPTTEESPTHQSAESPAPQ